MDVDIKHKEFCFVPTISSLAIDNINNKIDPYYSGNLTIPSNVLPYTHFIDYTGSTELVNSDAPADSLNFNEEHVFVGRNNRILLLKYLQSDDPLKDLLNGGSVVNLNNQTYNLGKTDFLEGMEPFNLDNTIDFSVDVSSTGKLWFNRNDRLAFTSVSSNPFNDSPQHFSAYIKGGDCGNDPVTVSVLSGGKAFVGDVSVSNTADLIISANAVLEIRNNGELKVEDYSRIIVRDGGTIVFYTGSFTDFRPYSELIIEDGGVVVFASNSTVRFSHAQLFVRDGGSISINQNANIQLWSGTNPLGDSKIHVLEGGELEWFGTPVLSGNGYFSFDQGFILSLYSDFEIFGENIDYRIIHLNEGAILDIEDYDFSIQNSSVYFEEESSIRLAYNSFVAENVNFISNSDEVFGVIGTNMINTELENCTFSDFDIALEINGESAVNTSDDINNCKFKNFSENIRFLNRKNIHFTDSQITKGGIGIYAENCELVQLTGSNISKVAACLVIEDVEDLILSGSKLESFTLYGIDARVGQNGISLINGSMIVGSFTPAGYISSNITTDYFSAAIMINGGAVGSQGNYTLYGTVYMDCSTIKSYYGVVGINPVLKIDAINNSEGDNTNVFNCKYAFVICYLDNYFESFGYQVDPIYARLNYWGMGPVAASSGQLPGDFNIYSFREINPLSGVCGYPSSNDYSFIYQPIQVIFPQSCYPNQMIQATNYYTIETEKIISIYPNPTNSEITIITGDAENYTFEIVSLTGLVMHSKNISNGGKIDLSSIPQGVYMYNMRNNGQIKYTGKVIVQN